MLNISVIAPRGKLLLWAATLAISAFLLDQWSKITILADPNLSQHTSVEITPFFNLVLVFNRGVSFGMLAGQNQPLLLTVISFVIIGILLVWLWRNRSNMVASGIGLIIGGAIGNVFDRVRYGAVVDFLDFHLAEIHWPAFNFADSFVFIGVAILCTNSLFFEEKETATKRDQLR